MMVVAHLPCSCSIRTEVGTDIRSATMQVHRIERAGHQEGKQNGHVQSSVDSDREGVQATG